MIIGDWDVDEIGKIKHLKCHELSGTWGFIHRCWVTTGANPWGGPVGHYKKIVCPLLVQEVSKIKYYLWTNERDKT